MVILTDILHYLLKVFFALRVLSNYNGNKIIVTLKQSNNACFCL